MLGLGTQPCEVAPNDIVIKQQLALGVGWGWGCLFDSDQS